MEALAAMWGTILLLARLVLHIGVPIYLYNRAKQERLAQPALWVLFGVFSAHYCPDSVLPHPLH